MIADNYVPAKTTGNSSTTAFSFGFAIITKTNLRVYLELISTGVQTLQVEGTHYTVTFDDDTPGGVVTFLTAPSSLYYIIISREISKTQEVPLSTSSGFQAKVVEAMLDKVTGEVQDVKEEVKRTIKTKIGGTEDITIAEPDPGKGLKWNDAGDGIENTTEDADDIVAAAEASAAAAAASAVLTAADCVQTGLDVTAAANYAAGLKGSSTSSVLIGTGSKTFVTQAGKQFATGQFVLISSDANPANYMHGQVTSYSGTSLVVNVIDVGGSGTLADWTISVSGSRGATGATGATGPEGANDKVKNVSGDAAAGYLAEKLAALYPSLYQRDQKWALKTPYSTAANRYIILTPAKLSVDINGTVYFLTAQAEVDLSLEASWDTIAGTDYRTAANRAGKDFYIYACVPGSGSAPTIKLSANSTTPSGYSASTSRKIGGFHGLCVAVGTISGHTLTGFVAGDVLPASIWDLNFKPKFANPEGMVFSEGINRWVDIYLASGTGSSTASVYGASITDTRDWNDFTDDGGAVKKKMLTDPEFQVIATGSNEGTNIYGSGDPGTTGGHIDTASRRMISNIGVEDACGVEWQWLDEHATMWEDAVTAGWYDLPGDKGQLYRVAKTNDVQLIAGGYWDNGVNCGSRGRSTNSSRWNASSFIGCRFCAEPV